MQDINRMKKSIFAIFLILAVCVSLAAAQAKKRSTKRTTKAVTTKKTAVKAATKASTLSSAYFEPVTTTSGLTYVVTKKGEGAKLKAGDEVIVNYTGLFTNGQKFDSSFDAGEPLSFVLGAGKVIKGWDEGLQQLRVGDHATLLIPSWLGYGEKGFGDGVIPPNATLVFLVEIVGVK
jgi:FKBP-type peptidyl-prolyl cis-trans isomerase